MVEKYHENDSANRASKDSIPRRIVHESTSLSLSQIVTLGVYFKASEESMPLIYLC